MSKYHAIPTIIDGIRFASKKEARRYTELKLLERGGAITDLTLQPKYEIIPSVILDGKKQRPVHYIADFRYFDKQTSQEVIEDVKGIQTPDFKIKRKAMMATHKIEVKLI